MARHEHYQVGDIIKYEHDGGEHEHTIHGVRYEEADGRRINIRYLVGVDYLEHDIPLPDHIWHQEGKSTPARKALAEYHQALIKGEVEKISDLGAEVDKHMEHDQALLQERIQAHKDAHEHDVLCPIVEREVPHDKVAAKTGAVKIPLAK